MRQLKALCLLAIFTLLTSCIKNLDYSQNANPEKAGYTETAFLFDGECISTSEKPLTRVNDNLIEGVYGIAISQWIVEGDKKYTKPYAYGIFDNLSVDNLKINLLNGYDYRVSCTMIPDAQNVVEKKGEGYGRPFTLDRNAETGGTITNKFLLADQWDGTQVFLYELENSKVNVIGDSEVRSRPQVERYHGLIETLTPGATNVVIELYRRYCKVKFTANGLHKNNRLEVQMDDSPYWKLSDVANETESLPLSFKNLTTVIKEGTINTESPTFEVVLFKDGATAGVPIMKYNRSFKRNYETTIIISDIDNFGEEAGVTITIADEKELATEADIDLPWQGGQIQ